MNKNCVCLICVNPDNIWIDFLSKFVNYDVYIIADDNRIDYNKKYSNLNKINIIQIKNKDCLINGCINLNYITLRMKVSGWDKAIYYFSHINKKYDNVWFFENDVFFYDENSLINIDKKYNDSDLLSQMHGENLLSKNSDWLWKSMKIKFNPPYYCAMCCSVRMSKLLLSKFKDYATKHKTLFFLEACFPSICKTNNLKYDTPEELHTILYRKDYCDNDINAVNLYHPVKDMNKHIYYRNMLSL